MSFGVSKVNGTLIFNDLGGYETRNPSTFWCIQKADEKYNWKDFKEIIIHTGDFEKSSQDYTYSKENHYHRLVPDFNFHSWPQVGIHDYETFVGEINRAGSEKYQIHKVGWIGNTNAIRLNMLEIGNKHRDMFDMFDMKWFQSGSTLLHSTRYIYTPDLVRNYSVLIDIEGNGYSGRLKFLLWSNRPLLVVDRPHKEYFFEHLKEWVHYIPVKRDLSDLVEKTQWCLENYDQARVIADNAVQFSKAFLSRDACYQQWNTIIINHV